MGMAESKVLILIEIYGIYELVKRQVFDKCVLQSMTYGCQTWSLSKAMGQKLRTAQRAMERKMLNLKIKD